MAMFPIKRPPILTILIKPEHPDRKDQAMKTFNAGMMLFNLTEQAIRRGGAGQGIGGQIITLNEKRL
jgi:hypothetical protein